MKSLIRNPRTIIKGVMAVVGNVSQIKHYGFFLASIDNPHFVRHMAVTNSFTLAGLDPRVSD